MEPEDQLDPQNSDQQPGNDGDYPPSPGEERHLPHEAWHEYPDRRRRRPNIEAVEGDGEDGE